MKHSKGEWPIKDRNVEFPNRYKFTKVAGTDDIYDIEPAPGEVEEEGDYFNKANMLQDVTAEKYGLDNTAVPNDVFNLLCDSPEHIGDLKQSLRADIGDPWLLCNGEQFRTDDYPELAKLCNKRADEVSDTLRSR